MSETTEFWQGTFGDEYVERNRVDWLKRVPFWQSIIDKTGATSVLEVGCNCGWNMQAIRKVNNQLAMTGIDLNEKALAEAKVAGFDVEQMRGDDIDSAFGHNCCDLVFTAGVLIHVPPDEINAVMQSIANVSGQYVLAVEYEADMEEMVKYRGNADRLWKRPFGAMYQKMGYDLLESGSVGPDDGFDNCTWWLLEKQT